MYNLMFPVHSAMNDLLQTMAVAGGPGAQWVGSTENLDGPEAGDGSRRSGRRMKELALSTNAIDYATLTLPSAGHSRAKLRLQVKGQGACFVSVTTHNENLSASVYVWYLFRKMDSPKYHHLFCLNRCCLLRRCRRLSR